MGLRIGLKQAAAVNRRRDFGGFPPFAAPSKGGQFSLHAKALPGNPYDGHTLETVLPVQKGQIASGVEGMIIRMTLWRHYEWRDI